MFLNLTSTRKIAQKGPKKKPPRAQKNPKEAPNMDVLKTKDRAVLSKQKLIDHIGDVVPVASLESFRALKFSRLESFRALKFSRLGSFRALES